MPRKGEPRCAITYDEPFKREVVRKVLKEKMSVYEARQFYHIGGKMTIFRWLRQYGGSAYMKILERNAMIHEDKKVEELQNRIKDLEEALANMSIDHIIQTAYIEQLESHLTPAEKKTLLSRLSPAQQRVLKRASLKRT